MSRLLLLAWALAVPGAASAAQESQEPAPTRYALSEALEKALARNPSTLLAQQDLRRAQALLEQARGPSLPQVTANATGLLLDHDRLQGNQVIQSQKSMNANVVLALPISARNWYQWSHAAENVDVSRASSADVRRVVAIGTARAWLSVLSQHRVVEANQRARRTAQQHYDYAHGRRTGGVGTRLDEVRAEQELASTDAILEQSQVALVRVQEALGVLLGDDGPADISGEPTLPETPKLDEGLQGARSARTDVKLAQSRADAAGHVARDSWADYLPLLSAQFQPFYQNPPTLTQPETGWQALLLLTFPLYDGGVRYGLGHERNALASQARISLDATLRQAQSDVRVAFESVLRADQALDAARRSAALARETLDLSNQAYKAGAITNLDVIDAERRSLDADTAMAVAEDAARQARLDLLAASGRFP